ERQLTIAMDPDRFLHKHPEERVSIGVVSRFGHRGSDLAKAVRIGKRAILRGHPSASACLLCLVAKEEPRDVHVPRVRGGVRTLYVAQLALIAKFNHPIDLVRLKRRRLTLTL